MALLTTDAVAPHERFEYWREVITRRFVALRPERVDAGPFWGELEPVALGGLAATRLRSGAQRVLRGGREIAASPAELFFLNLQLAGTSTVQQDGEEQALGRDDWSLVDATRPFSLGVPGALEHLSVAIPHARLARFATDPRAISGRAVRGTRGVGKLVADLLRSVLDAGPLAADALAAVEAHLVELVALALAEGREATGRDAVRNARYVSAVRFIEGAAARPDLAPAHVAAHLRVSLRYLQLLFAERGDSVGRRLRSCRLALAERALADPRQRGRSVTEIALAAGFHDASHFSRVFARSRGVAPRAFRRRALA